MYAPIVAQRRARPLRCIAAEVVADEGVRTGGGVEAEDASLVVWDEIEQPVV